MLRKLLVILAREKNSLDEKSSPSQEPLENLLPLLTTEQQTIVKQITNEKFATQPCPADAKKYKTFNSEVYQSLYPYLLLAYSFEKNGVVTVHTYKLACIFDNTKEALHYLQKYSETFPENKKFVHDACLFQLPEPSSPHLKEWINLAKNIKNLIDHRFVLLLNSSTIIDEQIKIDKAEKNKLLLATLNKYHESKEPITIVTSTQCTTLKESLSKKISEKNQFCRHYASKHHEMSQNKKNQHKNTQFLQELRELHSDRSLLHLTKKIGQYGIQDLYDVHQRALMLTAPEKEIFVKNGISEKYFNIFKKLDRSQAGKNIPDVGILTFKKGFYIKKLRVLDPEEGAVAACLGKLTDCCQSLSGENGEPCTLHGLTHPDSGFYVLFKGNPKQPKITDIVCAQTWVLRTVSGGLLFDSIEPNSHYEKKIKMVRQAFRGLANILVEHYNISRVVCGANSGVSADIGFSVSYGNYVELPKEYDNYRDSHKQLLLADKRLLGKLKQNSKIQLAPKKIRSALAESQQQLSPALRFTIGFLLQNKTSPQMLLMYAPAKVKKRINNYIELQLEFITLAKEYTSSNNKNNNKLIEFIKKPSVDFNFTFGDETILMWAVKRNDLILLKVLSKYCDINFQNFHSVTSLILSTKANVHKSITQFLIESKADVNVKGYKKTTPLIHALKYDTDTGKINLLLKAKANVNIQDEDNTTALMLAASQNKSDIVKDLLDSKADANLVDDMNHTALTYAAQADSQENIRLLLDAKSEIDITHQSPLVDAVSNNSPNSVAMLLDAKAAINPKKAWVDTALMSAASQGYTSILKILLEKKAEIDMQDSILRRTALMQAIQHEEIENVKTLVEAKANLEIKDHLGYTAIDIAERSDTMRIFNKPYLRFFCCYARDILINGSIPEIIWPPQKTIQNKK